MKLLKCGACGGVYAEKGAGALCPICQGFGKPDGRCTCGHYHTFGGQKLNLVTNKHADCPLHGESGMQLEGKEDDFVSKEKKS